MSEFESARRKYEDVLNRIEVASRRRASELGSAPVTLIAVSKNQSAGAVEELYRLGQRDFGENYVQELVAKAVQLELKGCTGIRWHFIGHLQTNKVKTLIPHVHVVQSVDSLKLAKELGKRWTAVRPEAEGSPLPIFIEVNIDQEPQKGGALPEETVELVTEIHRELGKEVEILGLMCIPSPSVPPPQLREAFRRLRELELQCRPMTGGQLSMGMSADFEAAIAEGATHVRVGTALFGPRTGP